MKHRTTRYACFGGLAALTVTALTACGGSGSGSASGQGGGSG
ncbi:hypothetical protein MBT84_39545 [Streptomyces sp. MBT84]|nr:hypothetical protein [Streptomyces sp. MBT84]